jgi:hypothetical protein
MREFLVVVISIASGGLGYLFATFWIRPILRYLNVKHQVLSDLIFYASAINADGMNENIRTRMLNRIEANKRCSADLTACYIDLPFWYIWFLKKHKESPEAVATQLMGLSNTSDYESAHKQIDKIKEHLRIKTDVV